MLDSNLVFCELRKLISNFNKYPQTLSLKNLTKYQLHTKKKKNLENYFSLKGKIIEQISNKFTIIKLITISSQIYI